MLDKNFKDAVEISHESMSFRMKWELLYKRAHINSLRESQYLKKQ